MGRKDVFASVGGQTAKRMVQNDLYKQYTIVHFTDGFSIGLAVTLVPLYISETTPSTIKGLLITLPPLSGSGGMFLSYCMVFGVLMLPSSDWRIVFRVLAIPSWFFFGLTIFYLLESPR
ncbi:hypothetical protein ABZP36_021295 [Zizania latifolia]